MLARQCFTVRHRTLNPKPPRSPKPRYAETAFFHRKSKTLLLTDAVLKVPAAGYIPPWMCLGLRV